MSYDNIKWGVCGVICTFCPFYAKTHLLANAIKEVISKGDISSKGKVILYRLKEIKCDGCTKSIFNGSCEVRKCAFGKGLNSCLKCEEFPCRKLRILWKNHPNYLIKLQNYLRGKENVENLILIPLPRSGTIEKVRYILRVISDTHMIFWIENVSKGKLKKEDVEFLRKELRAKIARTS